MTVALQRRRSSDHRSMDVSLTRNQLTGSPAPESSDEIQVFNAASYINCYFGPNKKYRRILKRESLIELLQQITDGQSFNFKQGMKTSPNLGESEYRMAMTWMRANSLCVKQGHSYMIPSIEKVRRAWNEQIQQEAGL